MLENICFEGGYTYLPLFGIRPLFTQGASQLPTSPLFPLFSPLLPLACLMTVQARLTQPNMIAFISFVRM